MTGTIMAIAAIVISAASMAISVPRLIRNIRHGRRIREQHEAARRDPARILADLGLSHPDYREDWRP